ncbi:flagellar basal body rod modification protein [bacterium BMS3Abin05]|nr:flagellar basal body rod modification protein [bacterium BMS3Abin05]
MSKRLFLFATAVMLAVFGVFAVYASNSPQKSVVTSKVKTVQKKKFQMIRSNGTEAATAATPLFFDDFEGTNPTWWPDASWNNTGDPDPNTGRQFSRKSTWEYTDSSYSSPTHSWHNLVNANQDLDFLFSPVFHVPDSVTIDGITSVLKGGFIQFMAKKGGKGILNVFVSAATPLWEVVSDDPHSGANNYNMTQPSNPMLHQWLISPKIDLTGKTAPKLDFWHNYISEDKWDYLAVDVSTDSFATYTNLAYYTGEQDAYTEVNLDLSAFAGEQIWFRFRYVADYGATADNAHWDVDDILVADGTDTVFFSGAETEPDPFTKAGFMGGTSVAAFNTEQDWGLVDLGNVLLKGVKPGVDARLAFQWTTSGDTTLTGAGIYVDDVSVIPMGMQHVDLEAVGAAGLNNAALGRPLNAKVVVANAGLDTLSGRISWLAKVFKNVTPDSSALVGNMVGFQQVSGFTPDSVIYIPTLQNTRWVPKEPGDYTLDVDVIFNGDTYMSNNNVKVDFTVLGPPFAIPVYREDFEPRAGQTSLADFGWTVDNGGGGSHTWVYDTWIYGWGPVISGYFYDWTADSASAAQALDETLTSPEIDISKVNSHNVLFLNCYIYFRPGHAGLGAPWGAQPSDMTIQYSVDGGAWQQAFYWADNDTLPGDYNRWPQTRLGVPYYHKTDMVLPGAAGGKTLQIRVNFTSTNSYLFGINFDEVIIYQGLINPLLGKVKDVPNDNGKQVRLNWMRSWNDLMTAKGEGLQNPVTHYNVWRGFGIPGAGEARHVTSTEAMLRGAAGMKIGDKVIVDDNNMLWELVGTVPAMGWKFYSYVAPTLEDSVSTSFMVSAHLTNPMVFDYSNISAGISIDNLAPHIPGGLTGGQVDSHVKIVWQPVTDNDLMFYTVYRSQGNGNLVRLTRTTSTSYVDANVTLEKTYHYAITATDFGWNESQKSEKLSVSVTSVNEKVSNAIPTDYALNQNYPNPFNPTTEIRYAIPKSANVTISIYNVFGQKVRTLVTGYKSAGYYVANWNGRSDNGREVSSGIYFYEIHAGTFTATKKMTLMR